MCSCFMACGLAAQPTQSHIENHKAYVQSWINAIRKKPDALVYAIKEAKTAANYMDWKAGIITDLEYVKLCKSVKEVPTAEAKLNKAPVEMDLER